MSAIKAVREGMNVVDQNGDDAGTVEAVKMGNPEAVTDDGQTAGSTGYSIVDVLGDVFGGGPDVPQERAERLLRVGYIKVNGKGLRKDYFCAADDLDRVDGDTVYLAR